MLIIWMNKNRQTRPYLDRVKLKLPILGDIFFKSIMARSNRTLASLVDAGVPILRALEMTSEVTNNDVIARAYTVLRDAARKGASLGDTAKNIHVFPIMIAHMMKVGEETGQLDGSSSSSTKRSSGSPPSSNPYSSSSSAASSPSWPWPSSRQSSQPSRP